jgi:hypothetical protein
MSVTTRSSLADLKPMGNCTSPLFCIDHSITNPFMPLQHEGTISISAMDKRSLTLLVVRQWHVWVVAINGTNALSAIHLRVEEN